MQRHSWRGQSVDAILSTAFDGGKTDEPFLVGPDKKYPRKKYPKEYRKEIAEKK